MLARVMGADMRMLRKRGNQLARELGAGAEARITCARGSDLRMGLEDRTAIVDAGQLNKRGAFGNIPCGEAFIAPVEGTGEGTLIVNGSIAGIGKLAEPVELDLHEGYLTDATGPDGARLMDLLQAEGKEGTNLAELGLGTNEEAILTGSILEDEKILGSAHVAFGASAAIGGTVQVEVHLDCVILEPTVEIDGEPIIRAGELVI
jgi:leucyl aminopeptidase (aminopeptidase T)